MHIPFDNSCARLPGHFAVRQSPVEVARPQLIRFNAELADALGITTTPADLAPEGMAAAVFGGCRLAAGSEPLALAYAGHQFGGFVPRLGDGRAHLLGEVVDRHGQRRDIQLKGSGRTAFSRGGDGRAALGPAMREHLVSEAMHALGVPSTRALALVSTGEKVLRQDGLLDGAIVTRVAASHIRVGTFQYFAAREDTDALRTLTGYTLARHYPQAAGTENPALALLGAAITAQAQLIARWMGLGFIHGVMNTDNCALSGETIDFGPCAFMDGFHPQCVFSAIDREGRYAWASQPSIAQWNLARFAETLLPLLAPAEADAVALANEALTQFRPQFDQHYHRIFCAKLGLPAACRGAGEFIADTLGLLAAGDVDFTLFFRHLTRHAAGEGGGPWQALFRQDTAEADWQKSWISLTNNHPDVSAMQQANPVLIPRNHRIEQAIQAGYRGDFSVFHRLADAWRHPFAATPETAGLEAPPAPEEAVRLTFCGT